MKTNKKVIEMKDNGEVIEMKKPMIKRVGKAVSNIAVSLIARPIYHTIYEVRVICSEVRMTKEILKGNL